MATETPAVAARAAKTQAQPRNDREVAAALLGAFVLSDDDVDDLARGMYLARLDAYTASYGQQAAGLGVAVPDDWQPPDAVLKREARTSQQHAASVAKTLAADLATFAAGALAAWHRQHGDYGSASGITAQRALRDLLGSVSDWTAARAAWKAAQVAAVETRDAQRQAVDDLASDVTNAYSADDSSSGLDFTNVDDSNAVVVVLPETSSPDDCEDYAGNVYPMSAYYDIPIPMHYNCVHVKYVQLPNGDLSVDQLEDL